MKKNLFLILLGLFLGIFFGVLVVFQYLTPKDNSSIVNPLAPKKVVIGFLPYWLLNNANSDYSKYITTLAFFGVRVDQNGNIQKLLNPTQEEPGWNALRSGKLDSFFA